MVKYRPHKETLVEAMEKSKEFSTIDEMYDHIISEWNEIGIDMFTKEDLSISENKGSDKRIGWKETRYVCTKRIGNQIYDHPQCIGMCSIE